MSTFVSISEIQQMLKISRSTVYRLIDRGELRCVHVGRTVRIPAEDVQVFFERLRPVS